MKAVDLLMIGAGPFGLAVAAATAARGLDTLIVGEPMGFWRRNMPQGMLLRSGPDWHLDPFGEFTLERYLRERGLVASSGLPLSRDHYLAYVEWFREQRGIEPLDVRVTRLDADAEGNGFVAMLAGRRGSPSGTTRRAGARYRPLRFPLLAHGNLLPDLARRNGFPVLDEHFQTSIPGLFITGAAASQDFGPFFGFTVSARTSARLIAAALERDTAGGP